MTSNRRLTRASSVQWVRVSDIRTSTNAQRELRAYKAESIATEFDPDKLGIPVVNKRGGRYWVIDGQHRIEALRRIGYEDQLIECQVYEDLTEKQEAEMFLGLNTPLAVKPIDKFLVALTAQRPRELGIARAVQAEGLAVGKGNGKIMAVTALGRVYDVAGQEALGRTLRIIRDAFGDTGMTANLIQGVGLVTHRYNGELDDEYAVTKLSSARGGLSGLLAKAEVIRRQVGRPKPHCIAAAVVETVNSGRGGRKIQDWWS
jgi:hypothetical protein